MTKIQKTAALKTAMTVGSIALIVVALRVLIELVGLQVFGALAVSAVLIGLIKMMYDTEVDKATLLDQLNSKEAK